MNELEYERYILSTRPVLWLPLYRKGGDIIVSSDGYGHIATVTGATWGLQGRTFDGIDDQITATNTLFTGTVNVSIKTIGMWVYTPGTAGYGSIFGVRTAAARNWQVYRDTGTLDLHLQKQGGVEDLDTGYNFPSGGWACVFVIIDGVVNEWKVYVNGELISTWAGQNFGTVDGSNVLTIGHDNGGSAGTGTFGELWIWNRRLAVSEIQQIYLATKWRYK